MSDETSGGTPEEQNAASADAEAQAPANVVRVHGKEFNVNDPTQKAQLEAWDEAHAKLVGRQTNELGELRQFYKERQPSKDEQDLIKAAKQKAAEGDLDSAIDMVFSQSKAETARLRATQAAERQNSEMWEEYFSARPELARLGRQKIKQVSETALPIFDDGVDAFKVLDQYWMPLVPSEKSTKVEKPPVTLSGQTSAKPKTPPSSAASKTGSSIDDILNSNSVYFRKK